MKFRGFWRFAPTALFTGCCTWMQLLVNSLHRRWQMTRQFLSAREILFTPYHTIESLQHLINVIWLKLMMLNTFTIVQYFLLRVVQVITTLNSKEAWILFLKYQLWVANTLGHNTEAFTALEISSLLFFTRTTVESYQRLMDARLHRVMR